jgi:threonine dehydrogenase-like Zn-dependent dehydrogenase
MKALVYTDVETLEYMDVPMPDTHDDHVLVKIMASGICGSDMHAYLGHDGRRPAPLILGHEAAGVIVDGPNAGRNVTINPLVTCSHCDYCASGRTNLCEKRQIISMPPRQGAFSEFVAMPMSNLIFVPDDVPLEHAVLAEPLACGWHGVRLGLTASHEPAQALRCLAIGGGAIGLGAALCLRAQGVQDVSVVEANVQRREFLNENTDLNIISPDMLESEPAYDLIIDGVGFKSTRESASTYTKPGGVIIHIGLGDGAGGLDIRRMTLQEISFIGTYTYTANDFRETAQAIFDKQFGEINWIEKRPMSDGANAFKEIRSGLVDAPKTILIPDHNA